MCHWLETMHTFLTSQFRSIFTTGAVSFRYAVRARRGGEGRGAYAHAAHVHIAAASTAVVHVAVIHAGVVHMVVSMIHRELLPQCISRP